MVVMIYQIVSTRKCWKTLWATLIELTLYRCGLTNQSFIVLGLLFLDDLGGSDSEVTQSRCSSRMLPFLLEGLASQVTAMEYSSSSNLSDPLFPTGKLTFRLFSVFSKADMSTLKWVQTEWVSSQDSRGFFVPMLSFWNPRLILPSLCMSPKDITMPFFRCRTSTLLLSSTSFGSVSRELLSSSSAMSVLLLSLESCWQLEQSVLLHINLNQTGVSTVCWWG